MICNSPSQLYHSILPLSPSSSWLQKYYSTELSHEVKVVKGGKNEWGTCSRTVSLGSYRKFSYLDDTSSSLGFYENQIWSLSYWNNTIAVGSDSGVIIILDAITGSQMATLSGHRGQVFCVTFSSDGRSLVSGSGDKTVKLWDVQTGGVVKTFYGHTGYVWSVSISVDCTRIASGSGDSTIYLWNIQTGKCHCTIKQQATVDYVIFSPIGPSHLVSISNGKVWQWDVNGTQIPPTYDGSHASFSPDHTQFAWCNGNDVTIENSGSREIVAKFHVADGTRYCCFSPDGKLIAAAAGYTAYVWDITSPDPHLETIVGHGGYIRSLAFSSPSSLISASQGNSIKFWKIGGLSTGLATTDPQSTPSTLLPIQSISLQPRAGVVISSDSCGVVKTWDISTGACKASFQTPAGKAELLSQRDAQLIDGRVIFVWYKDGKIHVWDTEKAELLQTLDTSEPSGLRISGDGSKIISLCRGFIQAWSMWTWELVGEVKLGLEGTLYLDSLYTYSSRVRIYSKSSLTQEGWDFGISGSSPAPFDPSMGRPHLDFIGGTEWQTKEPHWIKDTATRKVVFQLRERYVVPSDVQWDGRYLAAGYRSGEILILDFYNVLTRDM